MIDTSKPWYPQDYTLEEVLALVKRSPLDNDLEHETRLSAIEEDYRIRKGGVAGIFYDLRQHLLGCLGEEADADGNVTVPLKGMTGVITSAIAGAINDLEGYSIPTTKFIIHEYAVPVMTRDEPPEYSCKPLLQEDTRPASAQGISVLHQYWTMVNS